MVVAENDEGEWYYEDENRWEDYIPKMVFFV
jgi:hypothetical protein